MQIFGKVQNKLKNSNKLTIFGANLGERGFLLSQANTKGVYICCDNASLNALKNQLEALDKVVLVLDSKLPLLFGMSENSSPIFKHYYQTLSCLLEESFDYLLITTDVLMQKLPNKQRLKQNILTIDINKNYNLQALATNLVGMGYVREDMVSAAGEFSLRGDILDIFCINEPEPYRINFFDEQVETIKTFDINTYVSKQPKQTVKILPATLALATQQESQDAIDKIVGSLSKSKLSGVQLLRLTEVVNLGVEHIQGGNPNSSFILPFLNFFNSTIFDYLPQDTYLYFDEPKRVVDLVNDNYTQFESSFSSLLLSGEYLSEHRNFYINKNDVFKSINSFKNIAFTYAVFENKLFKAENTLMFKCLPSQKYYSNYKNLVDDVRHFGAYNKTVILCCGNALVQNKIKSLFGDFKIKFNEAENINSIINNQLNITTQFVPLSANFYDQDFILIGSCDLSNVSVTPQSTQVSKPKILPSVGDFVVHVVHGIGKCIGIEKLKLSSSYRDYVVIEYNGGDILYLPTENVDVISTYVGEGDPKLNKIGGTEFFHTKQKVKASIKEMSINLLKIYSQRQNSKGFRYSRDSELQLAFESSFNFDYTPDQLQAISDIKEDMQSSRIMERLVLGDVGYGKTEVALVAAYKAIQDGKQVAIICPTTILCEQHYNTALSRMKDFMVRVSKINRFNTKAQQEDILKDLKEGKIDLICSTHRLLSGDVKFKDLGLLILDEEQRFGVEDKEKLKEIKNNVDVLSLSATPIPRTLYMSLTGMRDVSFLNTPPKDRLPIQTMVLDYSDNLIIDACKREIDRDGQVLIVYNRVETITNFYQKIKAMLPDYKIDFAHGQMPPRQLEDCIFRLFSHQTQILISTVLIENGIDLPLANTLIVIDSDKLGLSQLYQLRGRIGRSTRTAYAYFTFARNKSLTSDAYKRLNALMEFNEFGSGYKIAMRDLEIRGAGDVLGRSQHGHMQKVGYDLYVKLLNEAVQEIRGEKVKEEREVKIDIALNANIPQTYMPVTENRIVYYNKISKLKTTAEVEALKSEIASIYGVVPQELAQLCTVGLVKNLAQSLNIQKIQVNENVTKITFYSDVVNTPLMQFLSAGGHNFALSAGPEPVVVLISSGNTAKNQQNLINFMHNAIKIQK